MHVISGDAFSSHDVFIMLLVSKNVSHFGVVLQAMFHFHIDYGLGVPFLSCSALSFLSDFPGLDSL